MVHIQALGNALGNAALTASQLFVNSDTVVRFTEMVYMTSLHPISQDIEWKAIPAKVLPKHAKSGIVSLTNLSPISCRLMSASLCCLESLYGGNP